MCNLYSITTNQAAIAALFRVMNQYIGNLPPMPGVFPDYPAPVVRNAGQNTDGACELIMMRWGMPPPPRGASIPVTNIRNTLFAALARMAEAGTPLPGPGQQFCRICAGAEPRDEKERRGVVRA
jgi:putative SOS response-associated peptidase YedK